MDVNTAPSLLPKVVTQATHILSCKPFDGNLERRIHETMPMTKTYPEICSAAERGDIVAVRELLLQGADPNCACPQKRHYPLMLSAREGHIEVSDLLIQSGAILNHSSTDGWTALHWAAASNKCEIIESLILFGCDLEARTEEGWTALLIACIAAQSNALQALLNAGANVHAVDNFGNSVAHWCTASLGAQSISLLHKAGADFALPNKNLKTPLDWLERSQYSATKLLS